MSAQKQTKKLFDRKDATAVYGYVRENFDKKYWIDQIIQKIVEFYQKIGGSLYVFGNGIFGRLGIEKYQRKTCNVPTLCIPFDQNNALEVETGFLHTLVLDIDNNVWCFGGGDDGQLGNDKKIDLFVPTKLNLNIRVISLSAGDAHSLLLCENGWVQSFGSNKVGQIGHGNMRKSLVPKTIDTLKPYKIIQISANGNNSAALTEDGDLFCFGNNQYGKNQEDIMVPTKVEMDDKIAFVACGYGHTLIISRKHCIYSFGHGYYGQLGHGDKYEKYVPTLIQTLKQNKMKSCAAGEKHSLCVDNDGVIWSFGENKCGQCGFPSNVDWFGSSNQLSTPKEIAWFGSNNIKIRNCATGIASSSVISEDGDLYVFGSNKYSKLGLEQSRNYFEPQKLSLPQKDSIKSISMAGEHGAFIL